MEADNQAKHWRWVTWIKRHEPVLFPCRGIPNPVNFNLRIELDQHSPGVGTRDEESLRNRHTHVDQRTRI